jgi:hypothetical protein
LTLRAVSKRALVPNLVKLLCCVHTLDYEQRSHGDKSYLGYSETKKLGTDTIIITHFQTSVVLVWDWDSNLFDINFEFISVESGCWISGTYRYQGIRLDTTGNVVGDLMNGFLIPSEPSEPSVPF